ncbi:MAG: TonB-dependent receptor [Xanthomonadales bacterium]|nr:TonB-dependent receptor [Xanthomonadales bacterium]
MKNEWISRNPLSAGIALALGAFAVQPVLAQDQDASGEDEMMMEEVMVTGVRKSLIESMDRKRNADGVVDAITSEDIGKFPDQNLAEALQRITGVSIDRQNNEGSQITVRGMGPEFNLVTLNGRTMPTAGSRSFDFADLATEGISAVEVYKTSNASLPTGGIGATVNILTPRPLDNPGLTAVASGKVVYETSAADSRISNLDKYTPEVSGLFSQTFADDTIGILLSATYQERNNVEENASVDNWGPNLQLNGGNIINNNQRADGTWWHPQNVGYGFTDINRERINGQAVLQWEPIDTLTFTLDYTYSEVERQSDSNSVGIWFECPNLDATINERGSVVEVTQSCGDYSTNVAQDHTIKENQSIGFNVEWEATDNLSFELDVHSSSSDLRGGDIAGEPGSSANVIIGNTNCPWCEGNGPGWGPNTAGIYEQTAFYPTNGIPTFDVNFTRDFGATILEQFDPNDIGSLFGQAFNTKQNNDIDQLQLHGDWFSDNDSGLTSVRFGYARTEQSFSVSNAYSGQLPAGFWLTSAQYWDNNGWDLRSFNGLLNGFSNGGSFPVDFYYTAPFDYLVNGFETVGTGDPLGGLYWFDTNFWGPDFQDPSGDRGRFWSGPLGNNGFSTVDETINSFYTQLNFDWELAGRPFRLIAGMRYEETQIVSRGQERPASAIVWVAGNEFSYEFADLSLRTGKGDNSFWLPNLDLSWDLRDDMIARFSYSRSIARPPIGALSPNRSFQGNPNVRNRKVSAGNPDLLPYESENFDVSLEWYYKEGSYVSVGYFDKKVDNFLVSTTIQQPFAELLDPYIGAEAEEARAQLIAEGISPDDQAVYARINENNGDPLGTRIYAQPGDPAAIFDVTTTTNAEVGNLNGWELAIQHMFGDSGFGFQANATLVGGDVNADRDIINQSFALPGLSDSANFSVFWENDSWSTRVAYNWRDEFLSGFDQFGAPVYTEDYQQVDLNVTWFATDNLAVLLEGINITEEVQRVYVRYPEQFLRGNQYGARWNLGVRYRF